MHLYQKIKFPDYLFPPIWEKLSYDSITQHSKFIELFLRANPQNKSQVMYLNKHTATQLNNFKVHL